MTTGPLSRSEFGAKLTHAASVLSSKLDRLEALSRSRDVLVYSYGVRGRDLAAQLRELGVNPIVVDRSPAAIGRARQEGFEVAEGVGADLPLVIAAGQSQKQIFAGLERDAASLVEALYAFDLRNQCDSARRFSDPAGSEDALYGRYREIDPPFRDDFLDVLLYRASLDLGRLEANRPVGEMWLPPVPDLPMTSFCDVGAADGDTLRAIKRACPELVRTFTIEPDAALAPVIAQTAGELGLVNRHFTGAAWSGPTRLGVQIRNGMMVVNPDPNGSLEADAIDALIGSERYDYIKFDVEGAEAESFRGAPGALKSATLIAFAAYHHPGDLVGLPECLDGILGRAANEMPWRCAFRHYSECFDDSIFYLYRATA